MGEGAAGSASVRPVSGARRLMVLVTLGCCLAAAAIVPVEAGSELIAGKPVGDRNPCGVP